MTGDALVGPGRNHEPDPLVRLATELRDLRRYVDDKSAQILRTAGLRAEPDLLRVLGSLVVEGSETVSGSLVVEGSETVSGSLDVTGPMTVGGTLSLPAGIIGNDALANPVAPGQFYLSTSGASVSSAWVDAAAQTVTVPSGFTKVVVDAAAYVHLSSIPTSMSARVVINGVAGPENTAPGFPTSSANLTQLLTGLSGGATFAVRCQAWASGGTFSVYQGVIQGSLIWFR